MECLDLWRTARAQCNDGDSPRIRKARLRHRLSSQDPEPRILVAFMLSDHTMSKSGLPTEDQGVDEVLTRKGRCHSLCYLIRENIG